MTVVFLSSAAALPRETSRVAEWARRLRNAGIEVVDHEVCDYDRIMIDIARCDAMVALAREHGSTWAMVEHTAATEGWDTLYGTHGRWPPKPTLFWFAARRGHPRDQFPRDPNTAQMLDSGRAVRLPDDFEEAVARAVEIARGTGLERPTA